MDPTEMASPKSIALRSNFQTSGVTLVDCPHNGGKDVADKMIIVDMLIFALDQPAPATVILISGDRDFAYAASTLRLRGYDVVLIAPKSTSTSIKSAASHVLDWDSDILGKAATTPSVLGGRCHRTHSSVSSHPDHADNNALKPETPVVVDLNEVSSMMINPASTLPAITEASADTTKSPTYRSGRLPSVDGDGIYNLRRSVLPWTVFEHLLGDSRPCSPATSDTAVSEVTTTLMSLTSADTDSASSPTQSPIAPTSGTISSSQHPTGESAEVEATGQAAKVGEVDRSPAGPDSLGNSSNDLGFSTASAKSLRVQPKSSVSRDNRLVPYKGSGSSLTSSIAIPAATFAALTVRPVVPSMPAAPLTMPYPMPTAPLTIPYPMPAATLVAPVVPPVTWSASAVTAPVMFFPAVPYVNPYLAPYGNYLQPYTPGTPGFAWTANTTSTMLTPSTPFVSASTPAQRYAPRPYLADTTPNPHLSGPAGKLVPSKFRPLVKYLENSRLKGEWPVEKGALVRVFWNRADRNQVGTEKLKHYLNAAAVADIIDLGLHGKPSKQPIIGLKKRWHGVRL